MANRPGGVLGDCVGSGKTATSLLAVERSGAENILVVSPLAVKPWWVKEIDNLEGVKTIERCGVSPVVHTEADRSYTLSHYEQFRSLRRGRETILNRPGDTTQSLLRPVWDVVIADEVHKISGRSSQRTRWIKKTRAAHKWGLSGSPIAERPDNAWSILNWFNRKEFRSYWNFVEQYCLIEEQWHYGNKHNEIVGINDLKLPMFKQALEPYFLVRSRADLGIELPPLTTQTVPIELGQKQAAFYKKVKKQAMVELIEEHGDPDVWDLSGTKQLWIRSAGARFVRLQQTASAPTTFDVYPGKANAKLEWLKQYVDGGDSCLILTRFRHTAEKIREVVIGKGPAIQPDYTVGTYEKLGIGLNFQHYNIIIMFDPPKSRLDLEQAVGRIERLGQERPMTIIRLAAQDTVDVHSWKHLDNKQATVDLVIAWLRGVMNELP
jgi:SNF2 family DNA or RNA helicase